MPCDVQNLDVEWDETTKSHKDASHEYGPLTPEEFFKYVQEWDSSNYLMRAGIIAKKNEVAKAVNFQPRVDGVFWMTIQDFCKYFTLLQVLKKGQQGARAVDTPYEEERAIKVKAAREEAQRIRQEIYDNGGWYSGKGTGWRGDTIESGLRIYEDPELFDMVTKAYMDLWGIPKNNAKYFVEHARTRLPPKMERFLANRKREQSKPKSPPTWMKAACKSLPPKNGFQSSPDGATSPRAAGSGLGAVRALQAEVSAAPSSDIPDEARAAILAEMEAARLKCRAELEARWANQALISWSDAPHIIFQPSETKAPFSCM